MIEFDLSPHECDAFVLVCMDFRQFCKQTLHNYMLEKGIETYDLVALPGSCKSLLNPNSRDVIVDAIKISIDLHKCKTIFLIHHKDCGAYKSVKTFESSEDELEFHKSELQKAKRILKDDLGIEIPIKCLFFDAEQVEGEGCIVKACEAD